MHRALLRVFRRLPPRLRIAAVHLLSPSYTVGAMCVIERADGAVLFVRHSYRPAGACPAVCVVPARTWPTAPGARCARRSASSSSLVGEPAVVVDPAERRVDVVYAARLTDGVDPSAAVPVSPEIVECRWFPGASAGAADRDALASRERLRRALVLRLERHGAGPAVHEPGHRAG